MSEKSSSLSSLALQKFKRNFWGVLSLGYIIVCARGMHGRSGQMSRKVSDVPGERLIAGTHSSIW
jgi:hypothetical protein